jgi:emp24/gp25L/p24 family/GOLD
MIVTATNSALQFPAVHGLYEVCLTNSDRYTSVATVVQFEVRTPPPRSGQLEEVVLQGAAAGPLVVKRERAVEHPEDAAAAAAIAAATAAATGLDVADVTLLTERLVGLSRAFEGMEQRQCRDRRRLAVHSASETAAHSGMMAGSVLETVAFIAASVFQLCFVQRWFAGRSSSSVASRSSNGGSTARQWA